MIIELYRPVLLSTAHAILGSCSQSADDAVQDTMIKAWEHLIEFESQEDFIAWLMVVHKHVCIDMRRKRDRDETRLRLAREHEASSDSDAPVERLERREARARTRSWLRRHRDEAVVLGLGHGESIASVASILGLNRSTVRTRLSRGRAEFRSQFEAS